MNQNLYPICNDSCRWWELFDGYEYCGFDIDLTPANTGRKGCSKWLCAACGGDWEDELDHSECMVIEFSPEG